MTRPKKPVVRLVTCRPEDTPHGVKPELVVTVHPNGILEIRPKRQWTAPVVRVGIAKLYASHVGRLF